MLRTREANLLRERATFGPGRETTGIERNNECKTGHAERYKVL